MTSAFFKPFYFYIFILIFFILFITIFFSPLLLPDYTISTPSESFSFEESNFAWPLPGYTRISSPFGKRASPISGASIYHSGIDIPAPEGTNIVCAMSGIVTFASWGAGGGYTIVIESENFSISYCHVSPNFIVRRKQIVYKGDIIGHVGPKNVYGIQNNPYKDGNGNPTNGATTGCHLHFTTKIDGKAVNPLNFYISSSSGFSSFSAVSGLLS